MASINTSGHKYGLVYPGVGWALWRDREALPEELVFRVNYLGGDMPTFALNFSRPGAEVVAQYYTFLRLGPGGLPRRAAGQPRRRHQAGRAGSRSWAPSGCSPGATSCRSSPSPPSDEVTAFNVFDVSRRLRERGWLVPAYTFPENRTDLAACCGSSCRNGFSHDLADVLVADLTRLVPELEAQSGPLHPTACTPFHH